MGAGFGVALLLLGCVGLAIFGAMRAPGPDDEAGVTSSNGTAHEWELAPEMAVRLAPVYKPAYLPHGVSYPTIRVTTSGPSETMTATYAGGLVLRQTNQGLQDIAGSASLQPAAVPGAEEAGFAEWRGVRSLLLRKGDAWVVLSGQPDPELVRVAGSLEPLADGAEDGH